MTELKGLSTDQQVWLATLFGKLADQTNDYVQTLSGVRVTEYARGQRDAWQMALRLLRDAGEM